MIHKDEHEVVLNDPQRAAVSWYFNPANTDGDPWPLNEPVAIGVENGQLVINGLYLDSAGDWCTFPEAPIRDQRPIVDPFETELRQET